MSNRAFSSDTLQEISDIIGVEATMRLATAVGGTRVYIPGTISEKHWLVDAIGNDAAQRLADHYAVSSPGANHKLSKRGTRVDIPLPPKATDDASIDISARNAARSLGVTQRTVHRRRQRARAIDMLAGRE